MRSAELGASPQDLRGERVVNEVDQARVTAVAVIGMVCRLPNGIDSPDALWEAMLRGEDLISEIPADRRDADEYDDPEPGVPGWSVSRWGGFIDDVAGFDPELFGIGEREATAIDPQHRLLIETSWEAVEHAGMAPKPLTGSRTGVFVGICHDDYAFVTSEAGALDDAYGFTGTAFSMALAGGCMVMLEPRTFASASALGMLSPTG